MRADSLLTEENRVVGVGGTDQIDGSAREFRADRVINASGPWLREVATDLDRDLPRAFSPSLAINVLLDVDLGYEGALALPPPASGSPVFFLIPFHGRTLAGTLHLPRDAGSLSVDVTSDELASFVGQLAAAAPHLDITSGSVRKVLSGLVQPLAQVRCERSVARPSWIIRIPVGPSGSTASLRRSLRPLPGWRNGSWTEWG